MAKAPKKRVAKKGKTSAKRPELVPQAHGGALRRGNPGNKGGLGVTPSALRDLLRGTIAQRTTILEAVMDGACVQKTTIAVSALAGLVECTDCGGWNVKPKSGAGEIEVEAMASATPSDRVRAFDTAAKYGLGALKEISVENVRERLLSTLAVIRKQLPPEKAEAIISQLRDVWA